MSESKDYLIGLLVSARDAIDRALQDLHGADTTPTDDTAAFGMGQLDKED